MDLPATTPTLTLRDIKILHLEPTDACQAACPLCARETDVEFDKSQTHHLSMTEILRIFDSNHIAALDKMFMCGNYGDPAAGKHTMEIYKSFRQLNPNIVLGMNTNGAVKNAAWWHDLADVLNQRNDYVIFSIDGLEDTNHVYRKNVQWSKLIENVTAFVGAGGSAHWDMLVYRHNQHQVDQCEQLARDLGFTWFRAKVSRRAYVNGLEPAVGWKNPIQTSGSIHCQALNDRSLYIDAQGRSHPCCWLGSRLSDFVSMEQVQQTWTLQPHPVCKQTCSTVNNSFKNQWQREVQLC
jgi:hypothetical protein